ncbi:hypothetical protein [Deinococcus sp.]|uniref:hypothetical protein n=1 Tax=Deinococcus sp. TaxID=47478 RepID=UPI003C7BB513
MPDPPSPRFPEGFLRRRNALWQALRQAPPGTPEFEALISELSGLIGWSRGRVLAGLGLPGTGEPGAG